MVVNGSVIFAGTFGSGIYSSDNSGASWTEINSNLTTLNVYSLAVSGNSIFASTFSGVFRSTDNGANWTSINTGLTDLRAWSLAVSGSSIFVGTSGGIYRSDNSGTSWTSVNTGLPSQKIWHLAVSGSYIFACIFGEVYRSTDKGTSWTSINPGFPNMHMQSFAVSGSTIFFGTEYDGVLRSTDNGTSWTAVNTGLTNINVSSLLVYGSYIFAGTQGSSVFRRPLSEIVGVVEKPVFKLSLQNNFKVLFSGLASKKVNIQFSLARPEQVSFILYGLYGNAIASTDTRKFSSGAHTVSINIPTLAAGCYAVSMNAGKSCYTNSITILK